MQFGVRLSFLTLRGCERSPSGKVAFPNGPPLVSFERVNPASEVQAVGASTQTLRGLGALRRRTKKRRPTSRPAFASTCGGAESPLPNRKLPERNPLRTMSRAVRIYSADDLVLPCSATAVSTASINSRLSKKSANCRIGGAHSRM